MPTDDSGQYRPDAPGQPEAPGDSQGGDLPGWTNKITLEDVRRIYVKRGYHRFEAVFANCDAGGGIQPSLAVAPFFISYAWFFYRKMYLEGLMLMGFSFILMFAGGVAVKVSPQTGGMVALGINMVFILGMMVYGKGLYWKAVDRKIDRAMRTFPDNPQQALTWLDKAGGTNIWIVLIFFALVFFIAFQLAADMAALEQGRI